MNKTICLVATAFIILASGCNEQKFIKDADGTEHKIIRNSDGKKAVAGDWMELNRLVKYKDSVLFSSVESSQPSFIPFDTVQMPPYFKEVHEGDSLVIRQSTDSIIKAGQAAPFMKKGEYLVQSFKIVKIFPNKEAADSAAKPFEGPAKVYNNKKIIEAIEKEIADNDSLVKADDKIIQDYMAKNNLKGTKTKWGTYVVTDSAGTGPMLTNNDVAVVNYTGRTFNDSTFDSNTNPKFGHPEPYYVDMSEYRGIIPGWIDGLKLMQKGSVGKIIIPSYLAYGAGGRPPKIDPNENLVFDIKVTDVVDQEAYQKEQEKQQQQMMQQRQMMEQMQRQMQQQQQKKNEAPKGK
jgi:FKBP-type peptidyl-prolyl cis-trans isomerase FkpA